MDFKEGEILYFDKPYRWTSFHLVNRVRWLVSRHEGVKKLKVGHAGTLDPLATGVMIVCTGKATKRIDELQYQTKEYIATLRLGATTPSFDLEHPIDAEYPTEHITEALVREVLQGFVGDIQQIPPVFSAVKVEGRRAYQYARKGKGEELALKPKNLRIEALDLLSYEMPFLTIRVVCSKGTYIRALARDIGEALHSGAHLTALQRTRIGEVGLSDCCSFETFKQQMEALQERKNGGTAAGLERKENTIPCNNETISVQI